MSIETSTNGKTKPEVKRPMLQGTVTYADGSERVEMPTGDFMITDRETGAVIWESKDGERKVVREGAKKPEPEKPKVVAGKLVTGEDGVRRFVPDDEKDGEPLDLTQAIAARDAEAKLSPLRKAARDIERRRQKELREIEAIATDADKVVSLNMLVEQLQKERDALLGLKVRYEVTIMGQSLLLASAQMPNQVT